MKPLPFAECDCGLRWPGWVQDIAASARPELWGLLAVAIILFIFTR